VFVRAAFGVGFHSGGGLGRIAVRCRRVGGLPVSPAEVAELEREYVAHRSAVLGMLRSQFHALQDPEELYQDAWAELLELIQRGGQPRSTRALLKTIARRRATDRLRRVRAETVDPGSAVLIDEVDGRLAPDEQAQLRLDAVSARHLVESLEPRAAAALLLRYQHDLSAAEIEARLGVSAKRLEKIVTQAYQQIEALLEEQDGVSVWSRRQRSLLLACEFGLATTAQRARAQHMLQDDPQLRAMLRQMRRSLRDVSALIPGPVLLELPRAQPDVSLVDRLQAVATSLKRATGDVLARTPLAGGSAEQVAGAGAGSVGSAIVVKAVLVCLAAGGTAAVCVNQLLPHEDRARPSARATTTEASRPKPSAAPARSGAPASSLLAPAAPKTAKQSPAASSPAARPAASPAPAGSREFTPSAGASSSAPAAPASAPSDGGGEFGP